MDTEKLPINAKCSGIIDVPVTYMFKYCQEQFNNLGLMSGSHAFIGGTNGLPKFYVNVQSV